VVERLGRVTLAWVTLAALGGRAAPPVNIYSTAARIAAPPALPTTTTTPHLVGLHKQAGELRAQQRAALQLVGEDEGQAALHAAVHDDRHVGK
jgi:hypothetical protein